MKKFKWEVKKDVGKETLKERRSWDSSLFLRNAEEGQKTEKRKERENGGERERERVRGTRVQWLVGPNLGGD